MKNLLLNLFPLMLKGADASTIIPDDANWDDSSFITNWNSFFTQTLLPFIGAIVVSIIVLIVIFTAIKYLKTDDPQEKKAVLDKMGRIALGVLLIAGAPTIVGLLFTVVSGFWTGS